MFVWSHSIDHLQFSLKSFSLTKLACCQEKLNIFSTFEFVKEEQNFMIGWSWDLAQLLGAIMLALKHWSKYWLTIYSSDMIGGFGFSQEIGSY